MGRVDRLIKLGIGKPGDLPKHLLMNPVEDGENLLRVGVSGPITGSGGPLHEQFAESTRHQFRIHFLATALAKKHQSIFGHRQMTDLPGNVGDGRLGRPEPLIRREIREQPPHVRAG